MTKILIACIGNIFLGDDAFGVEVACLLSQRHLPSAVNVVDFGIRGMDLAYALLDGYEWTILVDAAPRGDAPGTLYLIQPELPANSPSAQTMVDPHAIDPVKVLRLAAQLGATLENILLVGCEPSPAHLTEMDMTISPPVAAAIPRAADLIESLIDKILNPLGGTAHELISTR